MMYSCGNNDLQDDTVGELKKSILRYWRGSTDTRFPLHPFILKFEK